MEFLFHTYQFFFPTCFFLLVCFFVCLLFFAVPRVPTNEHETFLLMDPVLDPEVVFPHGPKGRVVAPMATEHELLNGYRAMFQGVPLQMLVDCEYSMTHVTKATPLCSLGCSPWTRSFMWCRTRWSTTRTKRATYWPWLPRKQPWRQ